MIQVLRGGCARPLLGSRDQVKAVSLRLIAHLGGVETTHTHTFRRSVLVCFHVREGRNADDWAGS